MNTRKSRAKPKVKDDTPNKDVLTPSNNSNKKTLFTPCRRLGLGKKKGNASSPTVIDTSIENANNPSPSVAQENIVIPTSPQATTSVTPPTEDKPKSSASRRKKSSHPLKRKIDDTDQTEGNTYAVIVGANPKKRKLKIIDIFNTNSSQQPPNLNDNNLLNNNPFDLKEVTNSKSILTNLEQPTVTSDKRKANVAVKVSLPLETSQKLLNSPIKSKIKQKEIHDNSLKSDKKIVINNDSDNLQGSELLNNKADIVSNSTASSPIKSIKKKKVRDLQDSGQKNVESINVSTVSTVPSNYIDSKVVDSLNDIKSKNAKQQEKYKNMKNIRSPKTKMKSKPNLQQIQVIANDTKEFITDDLDDDFQSPSRRSKAKLTVKNKKIVTPSPKIKKDNATGKINSKKKKKKEKNLVINKDTIQASNLVLEKNNYDALDDNFKLSERELKHKNRTERMQTSDKTVLKTNATGNSNIIITNESPNLITTESKNISKAYVEQTPCNLESESCISEDISIEKNLSNTEVIQKVKSEKRVSKRRLNKNLQVKESTKSTEKLNKNETACNVEVDFCKNTEEINKSQNESEKRLKSIGQILSNTEVYLKERELSNSAVQTIHIESKPLDNIESHVRVTETDLSNEIVLSNLGSEPDKISDESTIKDTSCHYVKPFQSKAHTDLSNRNKEQVSISREFGNKNVHNTDSSTYSEQSTVNKKQNEIEQDSSKINESIISEKIFVDKNVKDSIKTEKIKLRSSKRNLRSKVGSVVDLEVNRKVELPKTELEFANKNDRLESTSIQLVSTNGAETFNETELHTLKKKDNPLDTTETISTCIVDQRKEVSTKSDQLSTKNKSEWCTPKKKLLHKYIQNDPDEINSKLIKEPTTPEVDSSSKLSQLDTENIELSNKVEDKVIQETERINFSESDQQSSINIEPVTLDSEPNNKIAPADTTKIELSSERSTSKRKHRTKSKKEPLVSIETNIKDSKSTVDIEICNKSEQQNNVDLCEKSDFLAVEHNPSEIQNTLVQKLSNESDEQCTSTKLIKTSDYEELKECFKELKNSVIFKNSLTVLDSVVKYPKNKAEKKYYSDVDPPFLLRTHSPTKKDLILPKSSSRSKPPMQSEDTGMNEDSWDSSHYSTPAYSPIEETARLPEDRELIIQRCDMIQTSTKDILYECVVNSPTKENNTTVDNKETQSTIEDSHTLEVNIIPNEESPQDLDFPLTPKEKEDRVLPKKKKLLNHYPRVLLSLDDIPNYYANLESISKKTKEKDILHQSETPNLKSHSVRQRSLGFSNRKRKRRSSEVLAKIPEEKLDCKSIDNLIMSRTSPYSNEIRDNLSPKRKDKPLESVFFTPPSSRSENESDSNLIDPRLSQDNPFGEGTSQSTCNTTKIGINRRINEIHTLTSQESDDSYTAEDEEVANIATKKSEKKREKLKQKAVTPLPSISNISNTFDYNSDDDFQTPNSQPKKIPSKRFTIKNDAGIKSILKNDPCNLIKKYRLTENSSMTAVHRGQCIQYNKSYNINARKKCPEPVLNKSVIQKHCVYLPKCEKITSIFDSVVDDLTRTDVLAEIEAVEARIKKSQAKLEQLKLYDLYLKKHNLDALQQTTTQIRKGGQESLLELAAVLRQQSETPFDMGTLLDNMGIPHHVVHYDMSLDEFT